MPAGDAQRSWFPEMVVVLRREWDRSMSMDDMIELRNRLNEVLQSIRSTRGHPAPDSHLYEMRVQGGPCL